MAVKRRGNPNLGRPPLILWLDLSSFEMVVKTLGLVPRQFEASVSLKDWVLKNKTQ